MAKSVETAQNLQNSRSYFNLREDMLRNAESVQFKAQNEYNLAKSDCEEAKSQNSPEQGLREEIAKRAGQELERANHALTQARHDWQKALEALNAANEVNVE